MNNHIQLFKDFRLRKCFKMKKVEMKIEMDLLFCMLNTINRSLSDNEIDEIMQDFDKTITDKTIDGDHSETKEENLQKIKEQLIKNQNNINIPVFEYNGKLVCTNKNLFLKIHQRLLELGFNSIIGGTDDLFLITFDFDKNDAIYTNLFYQFINELPINGNHKYDLITDKIYRKNKTDACFDFRIDKISDFLLIINSIGYFDEDFEANYITEDLGWS